MSCLYVGGRSLGTLSKTSRQMWNVCTTATLSTISSLSAADITYPSRLVSTVFDVRKVFVPYDEMDIKPTRQAIALRPWKWDETEFLQ